MTVEHPYIIANWKMQLSPADVEQRLRDVRPAIEQLDHRVRTVICPSFLSLATASRLLAGSPISLGAQDVFWAERGAYTGEISPLDLRTLNVTYAIIGHSERRQHLGETDVMAGRKMIAAMGHGLQPILCVGESAAQRAAGQAETVVRHQLAEAFRSVPPPTRGQRIFVAYEPVWAIGTGEFASAEVATDVMRVLEQTLVDLYGAGLVEQQFRFLYGGSVNPDNITSYVQPERFHGALAATATLEVESFIRLVTAVTQVWR